MKREHLLSAGIVSFFTLLSRITGLIRDMVMARVLGSGASADAFYVAFRIPNMFRRFFAEGALTSSFVPVFVSVLTKEGKERAKRFVSSFFTVFFLILASFSLIGVITSDYQVKIFAPGFKGEKFILTSQLLSITFPYIFLISTAAVFTGVLNSLKHFSSPAFSPVLLNLSMIAFAVILGTRTYEPAIPVAWSVIAGGILQILIQIPFMLSNGFCPGFTTRIRDRYSAEVAKLMSISVFSAGIYQINLVVITMFSSLLKEGSVSYLYYASRFLEFPLGILIFPVTSVILPELSHLIAENKKEEAESTLREGIELSFFLTFPASIGLCILSRETIDLFLKWGRFTSLDVLHTSSALIAYTVGLIPVAFSRILNQFFYSQKDFKTPAVYAFYTFIVNAILCFILSPALEHNGLALATSLSSLANFFLLWNGLVKRGVKSIFQGKEIFKHLSGGVIMAIFLYLSKAIFPEVQGKLKIALLLSFEIIAGGTLYLFITRISGSESAKRLLSLFRI
jgi:putative peptidoglycan lipid II flippase